MENYFLLESLAACHDAESKLVMHSTVNTAFVNYLNYLTNSLIFKLLLNQTTYEQTLPISLQSFNFDPALLRSPKTLKDLFSSLGLKGKLLICKKGIIMV